jgi:hypothetical protein
MSLPLGWLLKYVRASACTRAGSCAAGRDRPDTMVLLHHGDGVDGAATKTSSLLRYVIQVGFGGEVRMFAAVRGAHAGFTGQFTAMNVSQE